MGRHEPRGGFDEVTEYLMPATFIQGKVDTDVNAAIPEVAIRHSVQPVLPQECFKLTQIGAEFRGRHRGVLPAGKRGPGKRACGEPGTFLTDAPQCGLLPRVVHEPVCRGA